MTITSTSGETPTGSVQFQFVSNSVTYNICSDGTLQAQPVATPCVVPLVSGTASVTTTLLPAGMTADAITATYIPGDANYTGGGTTSINYTVSQASTQANLNITPASAPIYGDSVTLKSTVSDSTANSTGIPTGTVQFEYSTNGTTWTNIGTPVTLDGTGAAQTITTALPAGALSINAVYSGDSNFTGTTSGTTSYTVNPKALTVTGITAANKPYDGGTTATLTTSSALLVGVVGSDDAALTGTGTAVGTFTSANAANGIVVTIAGLGLTGTTAPNYTLTAPTASANITKVQLTVTAPSPTVNYGDPVPNPLTPVITGFVNSEDSSVLSAQPSCITTYTSSSTGGSAQTTSCSGAAATNYSFLYVPGTVTVNKASTGIGVTLTGGTTPAVYATPLTFTAKVTGVVGQASPTGTVSFSVNGSPFTGCTSQSLVSAGAGTGASTATCAISSLTGGSHTITATYAPASDPNYSASGPSVGLPQSVTALGTTLTTAGNGTTSVNQQVTFTATVTYATSPAPTLTPTGSVAFTDTTTSTTLCSTASVSVVGGKTQATCQTSSLNAQSHSIQAVYTSGDGNYSGSTAATVNQTVNPITPNFQVTSSANGVTVGSSVTFTATLSLTSGSFAPLFPNGNVTFTSKNLITGCSGPVSPVTQGSTTYQATCTTSSLVWPSDIVTATYSGDANFTPPATTMTETYVQAIPTVALTSSPLSPAVNQAVTLQATITPPGTWTSSVLPTGNVTFTQGATTLCSQVTISGSPLVATCPYTFNSVASGGTISAVYSGDPNFTAGNTATYAENVAKSSTTTTVSSGQAPSNINQQVTFTATVTPSYNAGSAPSVPTGTVTFTSTGTTNATLCSAVSFTGTGANSSATATCSYTFTSAGSNNVVATYNDDSNFTGSVSSTLTQGVGAGATATSVVSSLPTGSTVNQQVSFTASITFNASTNGTAKPTGSVIYKDGATTLCTVNLSSGTFSTGSVAAPSCMVALTPAGTHSITATYTTGDTNFTGSSSSAVSQVVSATNTTVTSILASPSPAYVNQTVTFKATVTPAIASATGAAVPTGSVTFSATTGSTTIALCTATSLTTTSPTTGQCTASLSAAGTYAINAVYASGDSNFSGSSATATGANALSVQATTVVGTGHVDNATPEVNQPVTFSVSINPPSQGGTVPTGSVTFTDETTNVVLCASVAVNTGGSVTTVTCKSTEVSSTAVSHKVQVDFATGDSNYNSATDVFDYTETVSPAGTTTTLGIPTANPSSVNQQVTFTAKVVQTDYTTGTAPTGTVTFTDTSTSPSTPLCTAVKTTASGTALTATCAYTFTSAGAKQVQATYNNDSNFASSSSSALAQTVSATATTTALNTPASSNVNQAVTFTATITYAASAGGTTSPTGTVTYEDGSATLCSTSIATGTFSLGSVIAPSCTTSFSTAGTHSIKAIYATGDSNFVGSTSTTAVSQSVGADATTTSVVASPSTSAVNQPVTFTATVLPKDAGTTAPAGTVDFILSPVSSSTTTKLCAGVTLQPVAGSMTAVCTVPLTAAGNYNVTASYSTADANFQPSSATASQIVLQPSSTAILSASANTSIVDQPVTFSILITPPNASSTSTLPQGTVAFSDNGQTIGSCSVQPVTTSTTNPGSVQATCTAPLLTAATHTIAAVYSGDSNFSSVKSNAVGVAVSVTPVTVKLSSSQSVAVSTDTVTFTALVTPSQSGTTVPVGNVAFQWLAGATPLGNPCSQPVTVTQNSNGTFSAQCSWSTSLGDSGAFTLQASYNTDKSDPNFGSSSGSLTQTVQNFTVAFTNPTTSAGVSSLTLTQGYTNTTDPFATTPLSLTVTSSGAYSDTLNLASCTVINNATNKSVSDPSCTAAQSASTLSGATGSSLTYTVSASASAPAGSYTISVNATDPTTPNLTRTTPAVIVYVVAATPTLTLAPGATGTESTAVFNTATLPGGTPPTSLTSFACNAIWDTLNQKSVSCSDVTVTGTQTTVTGSQTAVSITVTPNLTVASLERSSTIYAAAFLGIPLFALVGWIGGRKSARKNFFRFLGLVLVFVGLSYATGCGGNGFKRPSTPTSSGGMAAGSYLVQVVATDQTNKAQYYAVVPLVVTSLE